MSEIIFIRHAETDMAGKFCGHSNPALNERGRRQLEELVQHLKAEPIGCIYTSDLNRAKETADALAARSQLDVTVTSGLREMYFGEWEGLGWSEIEQENPEYARQWITEYPNLPAPGGELFSVFEQRVLDAIENISAHAENEVTVVVTHAGVMRVILENLCGQPANAAWSATRDYCCTFRYRAEVPSCR